MQITRQADYATRTVLHLARTGSNESVPTSQVAQEQQIPPAFLVKIISQLSTVGILHTSRGINGGVRLAKDPKNITMFDVIEAIDGPIQLNVCVEGNSICSLEENCPMKQVWCDTQKKLVTNLKKANFAKLIE